MAMGKAAGLGGCLKCEDDAASDGLDSTGMLSSLTITLTGDGPEDGGGATALPRFSGDTNPPQVSEEMGCLSSSTYAIAATAATAALIRKAEANEPDCWMLKPVTMGAAEPAR